MCYNAPVTKLKKKLLHFNLKIDKWHLSYYTITLYFFYFINVSNNGETTSLTVRVSLALSVLYFP